MEHNILRLELVGQIRLLDGRLAVGFTIDGKAANINICAAVIRRLDDQIVAVFMMEGNLLEQWRAKDQFTVAHIQRIEAHGTEDKPCRHFTVILITDVSLADAAANIALPQYLPNFLLRTVRPTGIEIHIWNMMGRLVAVAIFAHLDFLRFPALMDALICAYSVRFQCRLKQLIQLFSQCSTAAVEVCQALTILRYTARHIQSRSFRVIIMERKRIHFGSGPGAIRILGRKPFVFNSVSVAEEVDIVCGTALIIGICIHVA